MRRTDRETDKQTDRETEKQKNRQVDVLTDEHTYRIMDVKGYNIYSKTESQTGKPSGYLYSWVISSLSSEPGVLVLTEFPIQFLSTFVAVIEPSAFLTSQYTRSPFTSANTNAVS